MRDRGGIVAETYTLPGGMKWTVMADLVVEGEWEQRGNQVLAEIARPSHKQHRRPRAGRMGSGMLLLSITWCLIHHHACLEE